MRERKQALRRREQKSDGNNPNICALGGKRLSVSCYDCPSGSYFMFYRHQLGLCFKPSPVHLTIHHPSVQPFINMLIKRL